MAGIGCFVCSSFNRQRVGRLVAITEYRVQCRSSPGCDDTFHSNTSTTAYTDQCLAGKKGRWAAVDQDRAQHVVFIEMGCSPPPTASSWSGFWVSQGISRLLQSRSRYPHYLPCRDGREARGARLQLGRRHAHRRHGAGQGEPLRRILLRGQVSSSVK